MTERAQGPLVASILRRWERSHWSDWLVPAAGASLWSLVLLTVSERDVELRRSLIFMGGPALLLSGLHARTTGYLHAQGRARLLVLPLHPAQHFRAARRRHLRGLGATGALGCLAILFASAAGGVDRVELGLLADWLALVATAAGIEPAASATAAWLGRRFPPESTPHGLQQMVSGGWTLPEAAPHLYVPALGLGVAVGLALPVQLALDRFVDGTGVVPGLAWAAAFALAGAVAAYALAPRVYARGVFEAVPLLAEASRTLAGPPTPDPAPTWISGMGPMLRLLVLQYWRLTPVPALRLGIVAAINVWLWMSDAPLDPSRIAVLLVSLLLWLVPATTVSRARASRARVCSALPLPAPQRAGRHLGAVALLWSPAVLSVVSLLARWGMQA